MHIQASFRSSRSCSPCGIRDGEERPSAPAEVDLRKSPVFNGIVFGTIRRIMHHEKVHTQFVGKLHEVLLDNPVCAGVGAAAVAKDDHRAGLRILFTQIGVPHPLNVVADKLGGVMIGAYGQVTNILRDIINAVRNNLSVGKCLEVMVERLGLPHAEHLPVTFEVANQLLLLGINTQNGDTEFRTSLTNVSDMQELGVPFFGIPHRKVLEELAATEAKGLKYLTDIVFGDVASGSRHALLYLRDTEGYPEDVLVLGQSGEVRFNDKADQLNGLMEEMEHSVRSITDSVKESTDAIGLSATNSTEIVGEVQGIDDAMNKNNDVVGQLVKNTEMFNKL